MKKTNAWRRALLTVAFAVATMCGTRLTAQAETVAVTGMVQTDATDTTASVTWTTAAAASIVYVDGVCVGATAEKSYTVTNLVPGNGVYVSVIGFNTDTGYATPEELYMAATTDQTLYYQFCTVAAVATPGKPQNLANADSLTTLSWKPATNDYVTLGWTVNPNDKYYSSGWQLQIYNVTGKKKLKTYNIAGQRSAIGSKNFKLKAIKNTGFSAKVRGYVTMNDGSKRYGEWSKRAVVIPPAKIKVSKKGNNAVTVKWSEVKNATKYEIYVAKNFSADNVKYKKVATVKKGKTSYVIKNIPSYTPYSVYVKPVVKYGKKTYKAKAIDSYQFRFVRY